MSFRLQHVTFFVPNYRFFEKYGFIGGHIEHFKGTIEGFLSNGIAVSVISSYDIFELKDELPVSNLNFSIKSTNTILGGIGHYVIFALIMLRHLFSGSKDRWIYFRYSTSFIPLLLLFFLFRSVFRARMRFLLEVNSFASNYHRSMTIFDRLLGLFDYDLILVSENLREHWLEVAGKNSNPKVHIVPNGVLSSKFLLPSDNLADFKSLTYLGVLKQNYGIEEFCRSFLKISELANLDLNIIGDGPLREQLSSKFSSQTRIKFLGAMRGKVLQDYLDRENTVFVYPGIDFFPFQSPVKLYDYLAFGKPIISAHQKNASAVLSEFNSSVLCHINDPVELLKAITQLRNNKALLDEHVKEAQKVAMESFGWHKRIRDLLKDLRT